jgi:uncharacterized protein
MIEQKKLADPSTLGLAAFVVSQSLLNIPNAHLVPVSATPLFLTVVLVCGGCIQLLCAVFEYIRGHKFGMTTFGIFGGFFTSLGLFVYFELNGFWACFRISTRHLSPRVDDSCCSICDRCI